MDNSDSESEMSQTFAAYGAPAFSKPEYIYIIAEKTTKVGTGGYTGYYKVGQTDDLQERIENADCFRNLMMTTP